MTKQIHAFLRRHMESFVDANGVKHDGPSLRGIAQAQTLGKELRDYRGLGTVAFYTSPRYRTQIVAQIMAQTAGLEAGYIIAPALDMMRRSKAYESAMKAATEGLGEDGIVAYCMNPDNVPHTDHETETPEQLGERYLGHVHSLTRHFDNLENGAQMRIESLGHEPGLTAVVMNLMNIRAYDAARFGGAAKTAEPVHFTFEYSSAGNIIQAKMVYRDIQRTGSIRL
jgi:broad specificity phosphatase PhoE